jgi:hypothetical protein
MFPVDNAEIINTAPVVTQDAEIKRSFDFDFSENKFTVVDGRVIEIKSIEAVKQWIKLFLKTALDKVPVYQNEKFGTTIKNLISWKRLNNGFTESELEREVSEGFKLNPAIEKVTYLDVEKSEGTVIINIGVMLKDGSIIEDKINV